MQRDHDAYTPIRSNVELTLRMMSFNLRWFIVVCNYRHNNKKKNIEENLYHFVHFFYVKFSHIRLVVSKYPIDISVGLFFESKFYRK